MNDNDLMPWGKYKGVKMANVPAGYLKYLWDNGIVTIHKWNDIYWYIRNNMDAIEKELKN